MVGLIRDDNDLAYREEVEQLTTSPGSVNSVSLVKRAQQRLHFLRRMKRAHLPLAHPHYILQEYCREHPHQLHLCVVRKDALLLTGQHCEESGEGQLRKSSGAPFLLCRTLPLSAVCPGPETSSRMPHTPTMDFFHFCPVEEDSAASGAEPPGSGIVSPWPSDSLIYRLKHKGVHQCTWHQDTLGRRSMIDFVVVSSDLLQPYVLDTRVKRGAELSSDHHLVVSWIRWQRRKLDRPGLTVRVCWERLAEPSVREAPQKGEAVLCQHCLQCGVGGELLTSNGDIVGRWKKYFRGISSIPPTCLPMRKRRLGTLRWTRPSPKPEVTEVVRKLLGGKAPGGG
ncbi:hypothetical protein L3Q82_010796 [Scortum barcoo]|uniref:Uncharacterized protein n=1 Tax=Scortum barcoo TaxID=214431 RepID=A0ACB8W8F0_9TELE|nr:hypothetical protein L3Q82_010796 [Scortum barcoo]